VARPGGVFRLTAYEPAEHELQISCTKALQRILLPGVFFTAIDHAHSLNMTPGRNGRPIGYQEAAKRKARGVRTGLPDYWFVHRAAMFAIELKKNADAPLSDDQEDVLRELIANEVEVAICWTMDQVFGRIRQWGLCRPGVVLT
jgi:hypothetical protein